MPTSGPWPSPGDYSTAIQNPSHCFKDPELKKGKVKTNQFGVPIVVSGNFAVVYQLQCGAKTFAIRCFIRPVTDHQQRYDALSRYLSGFWLPSLVEFTYLHQGILVRGQWYPIVRMEWVSGKLLNRYVEDCLQGRVQALGRLAARWRGVVAGLRGAHIAHGDLQHGNILVDGQRIRLVDYDGFFLPALRGNPPGEVGHPNYQHPERIRRGYYEENADAFSALVIYLSLLAVQADPDLWTFHNGDNLIFRKDDFKNPGRTPVWQRLKSSPDAEVRRLTRELEGFCRGPVSAVPDLETILQRLPSPVSHPAPSPASRPASSPAPSPVSRPAPSPVSRPASSPTPRPASSPAPPSPATIICPKCGGANQTGEIYCQHCAHQLVGDRYCPHCRQSTPTAPYCAHCGSQL